MASIRVYGDAAPDSARTAVELGGRATRDVDALIGEMFEAAKVLVHAARAAHWPARILAAVLGNELAGMAMTADLQPAADGRVTRPANGPAFGTWRSAG